MRFVNYMKGKWECVMNEICILGVWFLGYKENV